MNKTYTQANDLSFEIQREISNRYYEAKNKYKFRDKMLEEFNLRAGQLIAIVKNFPKPNKKKEKALKYREILIERGNMIKEAIEKGIYEVQSIADYLNVNIQVVRNVAKSQKICIAKATLITPNVIDDLTSGSKVRDIAIKYQLSVNTINAIAASNGIYVQKYQRHSKEYVATVEAAVVDFCLNNEWTHLSTISKFHLTDGEFRGILAKHNIPTPVANMVKRAVKERYVDLPDRFVIRHGVFYYSKGAGHVGEVLNWNTHIVHQDDKGVGQNNG